MIITTEERRALLLLVALLFLGQGLAVWEEHRRSQPDRELTEWIRDLEAAGEDSASLAAARAGSASAGSLAAGSVDGLSPARSEPGADAQRPVPLEPAEALPPGVLATGRIRINEATAQDLELLPGIGPALAQRILEERARSGPFRRPEDLERVKGIGPRKLETLRPWIDCGAGSTSGARP